MDSGSQKGKKVDPVEELSAGYTAIRDMLLKDESSIDTSIEVTERFARESPPSTPEERSLYEWGRGGMYLWKQAFVAMRLMLEWQYKTIQRIASLKQEYERRDEEITRLLDSIKQWMSRYGPMLDTLKEELDNRGKIRKP